MLLTLSNLEKAGLLKRKETLLLDTSSVSSPIWTALRRNLRLVHFFFPVTISGRLINEGVNIARPDDISYVTAGLLFPYDCCNVVIVLLGYAPLLVRLVEAAGTTGVTPRST